MRMADVGVLKLSVNVMYVIILINNRSVGFLRVTYNNYGRMNICGWMKNDMYVWLII
jgi:hypothetical protein